MNTLVTSYQFIKNSQNLIQGLLCLEPRPFHVLPEICLLHNSVLHFVEVSKEFDKNMTKVMLRSEILNPTKNLCVLRKGRFKIYNVLIHGNENLIAMMKLMRMKRKSNNKNNDGKVKTKEHRKL